MRDYELSVLINPDLADTALEDALKKVRDIVTAAEGEVVAEDNIGKQRLAYKIDKQDFATYVYIDVKLPAAGVRKVDAALNITDEVIRHLLVSVDVKAKAWLEAAAKRRAERGEEEPEARADDRGERPYRSGGRDRR